MRSQRLKSALWVKALLRQFNQESVQAVLRHKGDEEAGALLIILQDIHENYVILREEGTQWHRPPIKKNTDIPPFLQIETYLTKQKNIDPDLWIIEITVENCLSPIEEKLGTRYISENIL